MKIENNIDSDDHSFVRLDNNNHEHIHVMATHLELHGSCGHLALDAIQAHQLAAGLRAMASVADTNALAYNNVVDLLETRMREDEAYLTRRAYFLGLAKQCAIYLLIMGVMVWLGR